MRHSRFLHGLAHLLLIALFFAAGAFVVKALWNSIIVAVCGFAAVTFMQALGMLVLGLTLSGGIVIVLAMIFHAFGGHRHDSRKALFEKWHNMTEEQRREFMSARGFKFGGKD